RAQPLLCLRWEERADDKCGDPEEQQRAQLASGKHILLLTRQVCRIATNSASTLKPSGLPGTIRVLFDIVPDNFSHSSSPCRFRDYPCAIAGTICLVATVVKASSRRCGARPCAAAFSQ